MGLERVTVIGYCDIFDDQLPDIANLLDGISVDTLLKFCSFFLGLSQEESEFTDYKEFLKKYFSTSNKEFANHTFRLISEKATKGQVSIVSILSILQLFEYGCVHLNDTETKITEQVEVDFFKAVLVCNEINSKKQVYGMELAHKENAECILPAMALSMSYAISDLVNYDKQEVILGQFLRAILLFEFLESDQKNQPLLSAFLNHYKCGDWKEYLRMILPLVFAVMRVEKEGITEITIPAGPEFKVSCDFTEKFAVSTFGSYEEGYDFREIRSKPLLKIGNGKYRVIYSLFLYESVFKGLYFKLRKVYDDMPKTQRTLGIFRTFYGQEFSENYLVYKTFDSIFSKKYIKHSGKYFKENYGLDAEPDYYMRFKNKAFLIESKDIFVDGTIKQSFNYDEYKAVFQKRLYFDTGGNEKRKNKAVLQLIINIERLLTNQLPNEENLNTEHLKVYPIIVLHDRQFNVVGLNALVNYWFKNELDKLKAKGINTTHVRPITIIDIDTFLLYQENFKSNDFTLNSIIDAYIRYCSEGKLVYNSYEERDDYIQRKLEPFSLFITNHVIKYGLYNPPKKQFMEYGIKLIEGLED